MGITEDLADELAIETIKAAAELGDDTLFDQIAQALGATSTTTQEAFLTAVRVRTAQQRAQKMLADKLARARAAKP
ncbi:hypothetical protein [Thalassovita taeanensis]|uniref:Uncharacterized protein n=1 Tax=Thalassovita taeanensis TaxID=657014 RepID=A0A1H8YZY1_9RHOB|nr:hypothetical protein [Thalassovita taeanensis]SEP57730.1 hypothetical protein SAMN04488092_101233 [Thalassovita taeanensis]